MNKKVVTFTVAMVLLFAVTLGATLALLQKQSETITNTFVAGNIGNLSLAETTGNDYIVVPGESLTKDPTVTFEPDNNVTAYVFIQLPTDWTFNNKTVTKQIGNTVDAISFDIASDWSVTTIPGLYYALSETFNNAENNAISVISGNTVTFSSDLTQAELDAAKDALTNSVATLPITAYAVQTGDFVSPEQAWNATFGA